MGRGIILRIPILFGQPLFLWLGFVLLVVIVIQIAIAKKMLRIPFRWHRILGYVILVLAVVHGLLAAGLHFGLFVI
jgi:hypothetical protein